MYTQFNHLIAQQRSAELRGVAERNRVIAGCEPASRASGRTRRSGRLTILARSLPRHPDTFAPGQSFSTCQIFMEHGTVKQIGYDGSESTIDTPIGLVVLMTVLMARHTRARGVSRTPDRQA
jgi:hypothetical protein